MKILKITCSETYLKQKFNNINIYVKARKFQNTKPGAQKKNENLRALAYAEKHLHQSNTENLDILYHYFKVQLNKTSVTLKQLQENCDYAVGNQMAPRLSQFIKSKSNNAQIGSYTFI